MRFFNEKVIRARAGLLLILGTILLVIRIDHGNHHQYVLPPDYAQAQQLEGRMFTSPPTQAAATNASYACPMHADETSDGPGACGACGMALVVQQDTTEWPALVLREYDHGFAQGLLWFIVYEMTAAFAFGMTFSPLGWLATLFTWNQVPEWVEATPKRWAWAIGVVFSVICQLALTWGYLMSIALYVLFACLLFMFLEAAVGFCVGCWVYGLWPRRLTWTGGGA